MAKILICEDGRLTGRIIESKLLKDLQFVKLAKNGDTAICELREQLFQLVISNVIMSKNSGLEVITIFATN
jgi:CheY-like chemotaxis protein